MYTLIYEFAVAVNARDCIDFFGDHFPDVSICSLLHTAVTYFPGMMPPWYNHDVGVNAQGENVVEMPHVSPVNLHQLVDFLVNSQPRSIDSDDVPGAFFNAVVSPSSGESGAGGPESIYSISPSPRVTPIPGDGTFLRHAGTPFRLQMGDL